MTITQQRQAAKGKAFNRIMRIYHPKAHFGYVHYGEENYSEQRDSAMRSIIYDYLKEIEVINTKSAKCEKQS